MGKLGDIRGQLTDTAGAIRCLHREGLIDVRDPGRFVDLAKGNKTVGPPATVLKHNAHDVPDAPGFTDEHGTLTWRDLDEQANALANTLLAAGLQPGDTVGLMARDSRAVPLALAGTGRAGLRLALMNTGTGRAQFTEVAAREKLDALLYDEEFAEVTADLPADLPRILTWHEPDALVPDGVLTLDEAVASGSRVPPPVPEKWGGMVILTSGTTGLPKGANRAKFSPFASVLLLDRIGFPRDGSMVIVSPLFHSTGFALWSVSTALHNETVVMRRFDAEATLAALAAHRSAGLVAVPTMLHRMIELGPEIIGKYDLSALTTVVVAGSSLSPTLCERFQDAFGEVLYNLYGSTEVGVVAIATPAELRARPGTIDRPPTTSHLALFDDDGRRVGSPNVKARLFARTLAPFQGYTDGRTKAEIDGYMSTGDMAYVDEDGLWFIAGRDDDMIVSGGENLYPLEVENHLATHPTVADVAVIGVDDDEYGTRLRAFIVAAEGAEPDADELRAYVKAHLARYKVPRDVVIVDDLPRNPTGKLVRRLLPTGPLDE